MANGQLADVLRHIRTLVTVRAHADQTDRQLLTQFATTRNEAAFATLVGRHGPVVLGVCRRILRNAHDAEDAFQATFLVLARKAGSVRWQRSVGSWLYEVATRIAQGIRTDLAREQARKRANRELLGSGTFGPNRFASPIADPLVATAQQEMLSILDEELSRLPPRYLEPVILCYLKGKTHEEAAQEIGCPIGSMSRHLARAHELLRERLVRRGVALPTALLSSALGDRALATVPARLSNTTVKAALSFVRLTAAAAGVPSAKVVVLAKGIQRAMFITKLKTAALLFLAALATIGIGSGGAFHHVQAEKQKVIEKSTTAIPQTDSVPTAVTEDASSSETVTERRAREMRAKLSQPVTLDKGIDQGTTLQDALDFISDRYDLTLLLNKNAFKAETDPKKRVENKPIELPRMVGVPLHLALRLIAAQAGATYLVHSDYVEVTTPERARPEDWAGSRHLAAMVTIQFERRPLQQALQDLAAHAGINVVVDCRVAESAANTPVTATFTLVPLDTAVRFLADMADLGTVAADNVLYVTTKANAEAIRAEQAQRKRSEEAKPSTVSQASSKPAKVSEKSK